MLADRINEINERIAVWSTRAFSSMWTFYAFFLYGLVPVVVPAWMNTLLYWSNDIQLWSLPLIAVGTAVLTRGTQVLMERLLRETHDAVIEELGLLREERAQIAALVAAVVPKQPAAEVS